MANIKIDVTQVTYRSFIIIKGDNKFGQYDGSPKPQTFQLDPGNYLLIVSARGIGTPFTVTPEGTIDYPEDTAEDRANGLDKDPYRSHRRTSNHLRFPLNFGYGQPVE